MGLSIVRSIVHMLGGSIGIRSEVGQGTEVTIRLPLMRVSGTESATSTPSVAGSTEGSHDDAVTVLQAKYPGKSVALYGVTDETKIGQILEQYITKWFGLKIVSDWPTLFPADVILVDEKHFPSLLETNFVAASVIVLCNDSTCYSPKASYMNGTIAVEFVSRPFGPYKLAKALRLCLDKARDIESVPGPTAGVPKASPMNSDAGTIVPGLEPLSLEPQDVYPQVFAQTNGTAAAASESVNARMAVNTPSATPQNERLAKNKEFPFPAQDTENQIINAPDIDGLYREDLPTLKTERPKLTHRATAPSKPASFSKPFSPFPLLATNKGEITEETLYPEPSGRTTPRAAVQPQEKRPPRLLLVDDNSINLRLLQTYMRKRKYKIVDSAVNGKLAVEAAEHHPEGYDIIFMGELLLF